MLYAQAFVSGLLSAGVLTLIAVGFSMQWKSLKIVNLAHFSLVLLSAYCTYEFSTQTNYNPFLALVVVMPFFAAVAVGFQWIVDRFHVSLFNSLLLSFAVFIGIEGLITRVWGADLLSIDARVNPYRVQSFDVYGVAVPVAPLIAFVIAVPAALAVSAFVRNSYFGKGLRAVAQDREIAVAFGVNYGRIATILAAASGAMAALVGTLVAVSTTLFPTASDAWIGSVFAVVILGGIGSPAGAFVGAALIGVIIGLGTTQWGASAAQLITFVILLIVLLWRPGGLFARSRA